MNVLDLFSGIGGFSLGLERAGMRTVAFSEIDSYCQAVLRQHWPDVPIFGDVRELTAEGLFAPDTLRAGCEPRSRGDMVNEPMQSPQRRAGQGQDARWDNRSRSQSQAVVADAECSHGASWGNGSRQCGIDVICGGFPCQDISVAGKGAGIEGARSGLWSEYARIISEVRPRYVIVENVAALLVRGMGRVLGDLSALGYDAEWRIISAADVGAPHLRKRVWIVGYANAERCSEQSDVAHATLDGRDAWRSGNGTEGPRGGQFDRSGEQEKDLADTDKPRLEGWLRRSLQECAEQQFAWAGGFQGWDETDWFAQSGMGRMAYGLPAQVDRLRALGNAIVPQIAEIIGKAIMNAERTTEQKVTAEAPDKLLMNNESVFLTENGRS